jgi:aminocarboxymuconate-semialdehyde decarboxylase
MPGSDSERGRDQRRRDQGGARLAARVDDPRTETRRGRLPLLLQRGPRLPAPAGGLVGLDTGLAAAEAATGPETVVVCTTGVLVGLLDQLSTVDAVDSALADIEEIAKVQQAHHGRLFGTAAVPLQDTAQALVVLDHAIGELDLQAANLPPVTVGDPVDIERLDPFHARAELGVPLIVHPIDLVFGELLADYGDPLQGTLGRCSTPASRSRG